VSDFAVQTLQRPESHSLELSKLEELRLGDQVAWEGLIRLHQDRMLNYLFHLEGNYEEALDLCQETFFRAWKGIGTFRAGEPLLPWLYTIARNVQIEKHRRKSHGQFSLEEAFEDHGFEPVANTASAVKNAEVAQNAERVRAALLELPEEYRSAVLLRFMQDQSYEEIAQVQNCAIGTAKSRVFRGKEMLEKALSGRVMLE
jgi:RNA polymerase sigma-70 factor, ECF subfamily